MKIVGKIIAFLAIAWTGVATCSCAHLPGHAADLGPKPPPISDFAGLADAQQIAWASYGFSPSIPPPPVWIVQELTCRNSPGPEMVGFGCEGVEHPGCTCLDGLTLPGVTMVAFHPGSRWDESSICHEYNHTRLGLRTGNSEHDHRPAVDWDGPVAACNAALFAKGL